MRKIAAIVCDDCRKRHAFYSHDNEGTGRCMNLVREIKIQGIYFSQQCACEETEKSTPKKKGLMFSYHLGKRAHSLIGKKQPI